MSGELTSPLSDVKSSCFIAERCFIILNLLFILQLYVNDAPVNYTNAATDKGVIHGIGKVLEIQKNICDMNDTTVTLVMTTLAILLISVVPFCYHCSPNDNTEITPTVYGA